MRALNDLGSLAERIAIHIEKGEIALAQRLVERAAVADCVRQRGPERSLDLNVAELDLSLRVINHLELAGIKTVRELLAKRPSQLLRINGLGGESLQQIYKALESLGLMRGELAYAA